MARDRRRLPPAAGLTSEERHVHEDFARRLHTLLAQKRMSGSDLAKKVWGEIPVKDKYGNEICNKDGSPRMAARNRDRVSVYLAGRGYPDPKNLEAIADALGVEAAELAPDLIGAAVEREAPETSMVVLAGHHDKAMLRVNKLVPVDVAARIIAILHGKE